MSVAACADCLRRSWLLARLGGHLDTERARVAILLALHDDALVAAVAGRGEAAVRRDLAAFDPDEYRRGCATAGVELICRCDPGYPAALWCLPAPPAVLHVAGPAERVGELHRAGPAERLGAILGGGDPAAAIVGARRASPYGLERARALAAGLARAGVTVISGMAAGVDSAAHAGALQVGGRTVAVLAAAPERPYPRSVRALHRAIVRSGAAVSELGPGVPVRRWMFPARNRIIAALAEITVVVAAGPRSGAMLTAEAARGAGREVGAVPGPATAPLSWGPHALLRTGAHLVTDASDVLRVVFDERGRPAPPVERPPVERRLAPLLDALEAGHEPPRAFSVAGLDAAAGLAALAELELTGLVRRAPGGRFTVVS